MRASKLNLRCATFTPLALTLALALAAALVVVETRGSVVANFGKEPNTPSEMDFSGDEGGEDPIGEERPELD